MTAQDAITLLQTIDPADLTWHADRYWSASTFKHMIEVAHGDGTRCGEAFLIHDNNLATWIHDIADRCVADGADFGFIPCLAGRAREVWLQLLAA